MIRRCSIEGCLEIHKGRGYCERHLKRVRKHGDPATIGASGRPLVGDAPSWGAAHKRIHRSRGKASLHPCVDCGSQAREWSYNGTDQNELVGIDHGFSMRYSLDPANYEPRCTSCHRKFDNSLRRFVVTITELSA